MTIDFNTLQEAITVLTAALNALKQIKDMLPKSSKKLETECNELLSEAIVELLKVNPDINLASSKILAVQSKTGQHPTPELLRAQESLRSVNRAMKFDHVNPFGRGGSGGGSPLKKTVLQVPSSKKASPFEKNKKSIKSKVVKKKRYLNKPRQTQAKRKHSHK